MDTCASLYVETRDAWVLYYPGIETGDRSALFPLALSNKFCRMLKNRESAKKSKERKENHRVGLEGRLRALEMKHETLSRQAKLQKVWLILTSHMSSTRW